MKLAPYPEYKDSGVPWLGKIPAHWDCLPHRAIFSEVKDQGHIDEPLLSVTIAKGILPQKQLLASSSKKDSSNLDRSKYKLVCPNDIAYNKMRAWQGAIGVSKYRGIVSPAYIVVRLRRADDPNYFHYLLRTPAFAKEAERWSYGITPDMWSLRPEHFKLIYSCIPKNYEQNQIARFLDWKTAQINRFIRNKRRLIELLKEQKQNVINQAVTRGLDPKVKFKPSGVEWIGDIPEHWEEIPLKQIARADNSGSYGVEPELGEVVLPVATTAQIDKDGKFLVRKMPIRGFSAAEANRYSCKPGEILVVKSSGSISNVITGKAGIFTEDTPDFAFSNFLMRLTAKREKVLPLYLFYLLTSHLTRERVKRMVAGSTYPNLRVGEYLSSKLPLPEVEEQSAICDFIQNEAAIIDQAITRAQREIELMREYRTRLISDVVTGQVDVRNMKCEGGSLNEDEFEDIEEVEEEIELPEGGEDDE